MKKKLTVVLMLILIFFNTACSNTSLNTIEQKESVKQENSGPPKSGGTINLATMSTFDLDPLKTNDDETKAILSLIYEGLVKIDGQGMIQPALAESWEIDDTGRTYTIKLRTDVKWHNGDSFTSADVKTTFDRIRELKNLGLKIMNRDSLNSTIFRTMKL